MTTAPPSTPAITAVVNLHREGRDAQPTVRSAEIAVERARGLGVEVELLLVADRPDAETVELVESIPGANTLVLDVGDLGEARNAAAAEARGRWVAYLDGDDLWGASWLAAAHQAASAPTEIDPVVWHPELSLYFGETRRAVHHPDSLSPGFDRTRFRLHNAWTALCFVEREVVLTVPYRRNRLAHGFGFEDWSWNTEILDRGGAHRIVPDTVHAIRRDAANSSLIARSQASLRTPWRQVDP